MTLSFNVQITEGFNSHWSKNRQDPPVTLDLNLLHMPLSFFYSRALSAVDEAAWHRIRRKAHVGGARSTIFGARPSGT